MLHRPDVGPIHSPRAKGILVDETPLLPDYSGGCISNVVPALLEPGAERPQWLPAEAVDADQVVLFVLDGLGWEQLQERRDLCPTMAAMMGGPITTVAPSTTATALTSIATGLSPGLHGVVGYRMEVDGEILNVLRWAVNGRDARETIPPEKVQGVEPFLGRRPAVITKAEFKRSGFTQAHLEGVRFHGYRVPSSMTTDARRLLADDEPFVYCYYEGIDKVAHEYGLGDHYDAELRAADRLVADLIDGLPTGAAVVVIADHGQVDVGERIVRIHPDLLALSSLLSGEGRFRWLHARAGCADQLLEVAGRHHAHEAWVVSRQQVLDEAWFGPTVTEAAGHRLGDVALVARDPVAFHDPDDTGPYVLIGRHGSLTSAEMLVPLLVARA
jgi:predicted AlkP superfamily pyrophosphatase or phosphodiesterase